jgi:hypothetical protein
MMINVARKLRESEEGQTIVLGAACVMIVALSILVTIQIGWAVHQRLKLQDSVDAAAYSTAGAVARSLNFFAFTNRAQVVHYIVMMDLQSIVSFVTGIEALLAFARDLLNTLGGIACAIAFYCSLCVGVPFVGVVCAACEATFEALELVLQAAAEAVDVIVQILKGIRDVIDSPIAMLVQGIWEFNANVFYLVQAAYKDAMIAVFGAGAVTNNFTNHVLDENDAEPYRTPTARPSQINTSGAIGSIYKVAMNGLNLYTYTQLFDSASTNLPNQNNDSADDTRHAERIMAEIVNATRPGREGTTQNTFLTDRGLGSAISSVLSLIGTKYSGSTKLTEEMNSTTAQSCYNFTRDRTTDCSGGGGSGGSGGGGGGGGLSSSCQSAQSNCQNQSNQCKPKNDAAQQAKTTLDQANQQLNTDQQALNSCLGSANPPPPCTSQQSTVNSDQNTVNNDQNDYNNKQSDAQNCQQDAANACKNMQGACQPQASQLDTSLKNDIWRNTWIGGADETNEDSSGGGKSQYNAGRNLASGEWFTLTSLADISGGGGPHIVGIMAGDNQSVSYHCHYSNNDPTQIPIAPGCYLYESQPIQCDEQNTHFFGRISKWIKFAPSDDPDKQFNMSDYWALGNKSPQNSTFGNQSDVKVGAGGKTLGNINSLGIDTGNWTDSGGDSNGATGVVTGKISNNFVGYDSSGDVSFQQWAPGINAYSRARVYYHRIGDWNEMPNFFNPYWKAKLSPIQPKISSLLGNLPGAGQLSQVIGSAITH